MRRKLQVKTALNVLCRIDRVVRQQNLIIVFRRPVQNMLIPGLVAQYRQVGNPGQVQRQVGNLLPFSRQPDNIHLLNLPLNCRQAVIQLVVAGCKINPVSAFEPFQFRQLRHNRLYPVVDNVPRHHNQIRLLCVRKVNHFGKPAHRLAAVNMHIVNLQQRDFAVNLRGLNHHLGNPRRLNPLIKRIKRKQYRQGQRYQIGSRQNAQINRAPGRRRLSAPTGKAVCQPPQNIAKQQ